MASASSTVGVRPDLLQPFPLATCTVTLMPCNHGAITALRTLAATLSDYEARCPQCRELVVSAIPNPVPIHDPSPPFPVFIVPTAPSAVPYPLPRSVFTLAPGRSEETEPAATLVFQGTLGVSPLTSIKFTRCFIIDNEIRRNDIRIEMQFSNPDGCQTFRDFLTTSAIAFEAGPVSITTSDYKASQRLFAILGDNHVFERKAKQTIRTWFNV